MTSRDDASLIPQAQDSSDRVVLAQRLLRTGHLQVPGIQRVRICALINIGVLATLLAWTASESWSPTVGASADWMAFLLLLLLPFCLVLGLLKAGHTSWGLGLAKSLGMCWCLAFLFSIGIPCTLGVRTMPQFPYFLLWTLLSVPLQATMVLGANEAMPESMKRHSWPQLGIFLLVVGYCVCAASYGSDHLPRYLSPWASESSALVTLRNLVCAETRHFGTHRSRYSANLRAVCWASNRVSSHLCGEDWNGAPNTISKYGYFFSYRTGKEGGYEIHADPIARGSTGNRSFFVDESGVIRANATAQASSVDNPL